MHLFRIARKAKLTAQNGLHAGMTTQISGAVQVGSDQKSDVRLLDRQADGHTAGIRLGFWGAYISPVDGTISVDGSPCKTPVYLWWFGRQSIELRIGAIDASLDRIGLVAWRKLSLGVSLAAVVALGAGTFLSPTLSAATAPKPVVQTAQDVQVPPPAQPLSETMLAEKITSELAFFDLTEIVQFELTAHEGRPLAVVTKGGLSDAEMQRYRSFLIHYDQIQAAPPLRSEVAVSAQETYSLPQIRMVQIQPELAIIDGQGNALGVGDRFADGWQVMDISPQSFTLTRFGHTQVVELVDLKDDTQEASE